MPNNLASFSTFDQKRRLVFVFEDDSPVGLPWPLSGRWRGCGVTAGRTFSTCAANCTSPAMPDPGPPMKPGFDVSDFLLKAPAGRFPGIGGED